MREGRTFDVPKQAQQDWPDAQSGNRAQQPAQVEARRAQPRMQRIATREQARQRTGVRW